MGDAVRNNQRVSCSENGANCHQGNPGAPASHAKARNKGLCDTSGGRKLGEAGRSTLISTLGLSTKHCRIHSTVVAGARC